MDLTTAIITGVAIKVCGLLGLWMRLRWRSRHEQVERSYLDGLSGIAPAGCSWEVDDERGDGKRLRIRVTAAPAGGRDGAA